jgi:branched-chain amino acid transport system permease protein
VFILVLEAIILGILTGGIYAVMASGLTLIFGVLDVINIAQGILVILGAYLTYTVEQSLHIDPFLGLLIVIPVMFVLGYGFEAIFLRRIKTNRVMISILITYAMSLLIEGLINIFYPTVPVQIQAPYLDQSFLLFPGFYLSYAYLFVFILSIVVLTALYFIIYRTKFGFSVLASIQNSTAAKLIGIDIEQVTAITFGIGVALAAAGGLGYGMTQPFNTTNSYDLIARLLVIIVLGGMGSLQGALIGAILMVVIGDVTQVIWSAQWASTVFYVLLVILLLFRPQGLFGKAQGRKQ